MIDKADIRNQILSEIHKVENNSELQSRLDSLTVFDGNKNLDMKTFYSDFDNIISWGEINRIQNRNDIVKTKEMFQKILNILVWAKTFWVESIIAGNL